MMDSKELLLYLEREKLKKEAIESSEKPIKNSSLSLKQVMMGSGGSLAKDEINATSDDGKNSSSSSQISNIVSPIQTDSTIAKAEIGAFKNISESHGNSSGISAVSAKIVDDGSVKVSSFGAAKISGSYGSVTTVTNFAIVKFTGADNFGKSAYTIGKQAGVRAQKAIDYISKDGDLDKEQIVKNSQQQLEYLSREVAKDASLGNDFRSGILYDKSGNEMSIAQAKEMFSDNITGERRVVYSPNPNLKMNDKEFQKNIDRVLHDFGKDYHKNFEYIYAIHRNTDNPHAHILMKTDDIGGGGVEMFKDELFELKMRFYENTQAIAESKKNMFTFFYKDKSHFSTAMQIGRFTGDIPGADFTKQNIYLAENIAKKYDLAFDEKAMGKNTENVTKFFEENKDKYNEFITNAKNRYANTFTKSSSDANALTTKYNLGEIPKDIEGFSEFLKKHEKLFLADKIAADKGINLTNKDAKNLTLDLVKNKNGNLTQKGVANFQKSMKWFDKNENAVREWNSENKNRMSKETFGRLDNLNTRVDMPFEMPKDRMSAITLTHEYKNDKMAFANDTRKALVDIVEARIKYFQKASKINEISKEEKKTNIGRLDGLRGRIKAYDDITEASLKKYGIDTSFFSKDEKTIEMDGIKLENQDVTHRFNALLAKALQNPEFTSEQKEKIEKISYVAKKQDQVSVSALENAGFKREELQKQFNFEKVESNQQIINFRKTDEYKDLSRTTLKDWKQSNLGSYKLTKAVASDKQINFTNKIADKLYEDIDTNNMNAKEVSDYIKNNSGTFNNAIKNPTEHLLKIDASQLSGAQQEKYFTDLTRAEMFAAYKKDIDTLERLDQKHEQEFPQTSLEEKQIKIDLYSTALDIKSKDYIDVINKEIIGVQYEENVQKYGLDKAYNIAKYLKEDGLNYHDEKYKILTDLVLEKQFDKLMEKHDGTNDKELESRNLRLISFIDEFKEQLQETREYEAKINEIDSATDENLHKALNLIETNKNELQEHDLRDLEMKLHVNIEAHFETIEKNLEKEYMLHSRFLQEELESAKEAKIEDIKNLIEKGNLQEADMHLKESGLDKETQAELKDDIELTKTLASVSKAQEDTPEFENQQNEENQKVKDAAAQEKVLEDDIGKQQTAEAGIGM